MARKGNQLIIRIPKFGTVTYNAGETIHASHREFLAESDKQFVDKDGKVTFPEKPKKDAGKPAK